MPRVSSHRRQENRNRRRKARRSLSRMLLDDETFAPEDDYTDLLRVEVMARREPAGRLVAFGPFEAEDQ